MLQMSCILHIAPVSGAASLFAKSNVLGVTQNGPASWTLEVPTAPDGFEWLAHVQQMSRLEDYQVDTLADTHEIEIAADDVSDAPVVLYVAAMLAPVAEPEPTDPRLFDDGGEDDDE